MQNVNLSVQYEESVLVRGNLELWVSWCDDSRCFSQQSWTSPLTECALLFNLLVVEGMWTVCQASSSPPPPTTHVVTMSLFQPVQKCIAVWFNKMRCKKVTSHLTQFQQEPPAHTSKFQQDTVCTEVHILVNTLHSNYFTCFLCQ